MPPAGMPRPPQAALDALVVHLETSIDKAALASPTLRHSAIHRLNRSEYGNAIRDLFALERRRLGAPASRRGSLRLRQQRDRAEHLDVADGAISLGRLEDQQPRGRRARRSRRRSKRSACAAISRSTITSLACRSARAAASPSATTFPSTASTSISPRLYRETVNIVRGLELEHDLEVTLDGQRIVLARFGGPKDEQANYLQPTLAGDEMEKRFQKRLKITAGPAHDRRRVPQEELRDDPGAAAAVRARAARSDHAGRHSRARQGHDRRAVQRDPVGQLAEPRRRSSPASPRPSATTRRARRTILSSLARRAYRGPVSDADMTRLLDFYAKERASGGDFDAGIEGALRFLLVHPRFLFRVEQDPDNAAPGSNLSRSAISSWRRGCRSSSGAAFRTRSC